MKELWIESREWVEKVNTYKPVTLSRLREVGIPDKFLEDYDVQHPDLDFMFDDSYMLNNTFLLSENHIGTESANHKMVEVVHKFLYRMIPNRTIDVISSDKVTKKSKYTNTHTHWKKYIRCS